MEQLLIIERKITHLKKALQDKSGKHCFKLKIKLWRLKHKYKKIESKLNSTIFYKK